MIAEFYTNPASADMPRGGLLQLPLSTIEADDDDSMFDDVPLSPEAIQDGAGAVDEEIVDNEDSSTAEDEKTPENEVIETVSLRPYQDAAIKAILRQFKGNRGEGIEPVRSTLCVMATGTGKTVTFAKLGSVAQSYDHAVLLLVHRDELIRQIARAFARVGIHVLVEKAGERALGGFGMLSNVVAASVQTLRGDRLAAWPRDAFKLIVVDECHHATAQTYRTILDHFHTAKVVGFTATADRLDGKNVGQVFESLAYEYNLRDAIGDQWLVPIEAFPVETDPKIDLRDLRVTGGDFNAGDLEKAINDNIGTLVNACVSTNALEDRRTIAFTPDIGSAKALSYALNDVGITADWVAGNSPDRKSKFERHQAGKYQVLCNCMIATEGYDDPAISAVLICRPTKSRALYSQMVGRGTRLLPDGSKANCRVVDFAYITDKHALVSPVDLYDNSKIADEVVDRARELVETGQERDIDKALETASFEFEEAERVRIKKRLVQARAKTFDPVAASDVLGIRDKEAFGWNNTKPATPKMIAALRKFKIDAPDDMAFGVAKKLLDTCITRAHYSLATPKQVATCIRLGADPGAARRMSFDDAGAYITQNKTW